MKIIKLLKENIGGVLIVLFLAVAVCISLSTYTRDKFTTEIPMQYTVDTEVYGGNEADVYVTDGIDLKKGTYRVYVTYASEADRNYVYVSAVTKGYRTFLSDKEYLNHQSESIDYDIWALEDATNVQFKLRYRGNGALTVKSIRIVQNNKLAKLYLTLTTLITTVLCAFYALYKHGVFGRMRASEKVAALVILFTAIYATYPGFSTGIVASDDLPFHLLRIEGLAQALSEGQFPVRMQSLWAYGYGYPVSTYYGDLLLYFPAFLRMNGMPLQTAFTSYALLINLLTAAFAFLSFRKVTKHDFAAMTAMVVYTLAPMRISQLFPRGMTGEATAYAFLPLILAGLYMLYVTGEKKSWIWLTVGFSGLITCHVITTYLAGVFCVITAIVFIKKTFRKDTLLSILKLLVFVPLLNAWYLLPFLSSLRDVSIGESAIDTVRMQRFGLNLSQLFHVSYLSTGTVNMADAGPAGEDAFGLGLAAFLGFLFYALVLCYVRQKGNKVQKMGIYLLALTAVTLYMTTCYFPWDSICSGLGGLSVLIYKIQFGYRLTKFATLLCCTLMAMAIAEIARFRAEDADVSVRMTGKIYSASMMVICLIFGIFSVSQLMDDFLNNNASKQIYNATSLGQTSQSMTEYLIPGTDVSKLVSTDSPKVSGVLVAAYEKNGTSVAISVLGDAESGYVELPLLWYPQYRVTENGTETEVTLVKGDNNVVRLEIPSNFSGDLSVEYKEPVSWKLAEFVTLFTFLGLIGWGVLQKKKQK